VTRSLPTTEWPRRAVERIRALHGEFADLPAGEWAAFAARLRPRRCARGQSLLRQGEACDWIAFLLRGAVRLVCRDGDRAVILGFDFEDRFIGDYASFLTGAGSAFAIECLEDCELVLLSRADLQALYDRHPCWQRVGRQLAERQYVRRSLKEQQIRLLSPTERYQQIVADKPYLVRRVPLRELASFLGVAPETLSRIRRRLAASRAFSAEQR
jgi:CRP-like cAMP-binding protein